VSSGGGIPGPAVAIATAGAFMIFIGIRNVPVLAGLRELAAGKLPAARNADNTATKSVYQALFTAGSSSGGGSGAVVQAGTAGSTGGAFPALVAATAAFAGDHYSQARRWEAGYSDCSSFAGKSLKAAGVTPPGISVTGSYLTWGLLAKIPREQVQAGDLCVNAAHMIIATSNTDGIGQQNSRVNVRQDKIENLMPGPFTCLRYTGPKPVSAAGMAT